MKKIILLLSLVNFISLYGNTLSMHESEKLLHSNYQFYNDVPNIINCKDNIKRPLPIQKICKDKKLLEIFNLLSKANVYAYENATHKEVNHRTFNKKNLHINFKKYIEKGKLNVNQLSFDLKKKIEDFLGGESPYFKLLLFNRLYFAQLNKNGIRLISRNGDKIYLGKSCDVLDSKNNRGYWYYNANKCYLTLGNRTDFFEDILDSRKYKCKKINTIQNLEKIIKKFPNRTVAYYNLGDAYWALGEKEKAINAYTIYVEQMCHKGLQKKIPKVVLKRIEIKK